MHLIYDVKHDGRRKCRCVAGGHLTGPPIESVYSPVVSIRGLVEQVKILVHRYWECLPRIHYKGESLYNRWPRIWRT